MFFVRPMSGSSVLGRLALLAVVAAGPGAMLVMSAGCASPPDVDAPRARAGAGAGTVWARQAESEFDAGADRRPSADTMYGLARVLFTQGRTTEAITLLRHTIGQYPNYLPAYNALAEAQLRIWQTDEAVTTLQAGLQRAPEDPVLHNNLGMVHFLEERYDEALWHFERAAAARPEVALYRGNQAAALGMLGRFQEARQLYGPIVHPADLDANIDILHQARRTLESRRPRTDASMLDMETAGEPPANEVH